MYLAFFDGSPTRFSTGDGFVSAAAERAISIIHWTVLLEAVFSLLVPPLVFHTKRETIFLLSAKIRPPSLCPLSF